MQIFTWIFCTLLVVVTSRNEKQEAAHSFSSGLTENQTLLLKGYYCSSDGECAPRLYCHAPGHAHSQCTPCKRRVRRCSRDRMCCPGNRCRKGLCIKASRRRHSNKLPQSTTHTRKNGPLTKPRRGELGAKCVRSTDCGRGLCCARHLWKRVCKAEPQEGAVCPAPWRRKHPQSDASELFQLCSCSHGLSCRARNITHSHTHQHTHTLTHTRLHTCHRL